MSSFPSRSTSRSSPRSSSQMTIRQFLAERRSSSSSKTDDGDHGVSVLNIADDPYYNAASSKDMVKQFTSYIHLPSCLHQNWWDKHHPETPNRCLQIHRRLDELGLLKRCNNIDFIDNQLPEKEVCMRYINLVHDLHTIKTMKKLCIGNNESDCTQYDSIFVNGSDSFQAAVEAVQAAILVVDDVATGKCQNGFANIRPPGHHATKDTPGGYCFFNNVAICAKHLLKQRLAKRILIVDIDVHHGQGTQRCFYDDCNVLYFSIHRYEHGTFWPNLRESNTDYIGAERGTGYNVNVPLNKTKLHDSDYMAIVVNILLPIAYEYDPDFILVSAGYDACIGCAEGQMNISPAFYGHLITLLSGLANGKVVCVLEGGYCLESLSEAAAMTVRALLGDPCNRLSEHREINPSVIESINDVKFYLRRHWSCFAYDQTFRCDNPLTYDRYNRHVVVPRYFGAVDKAPFATRSCYPVNAIFTIRRLMNNFLALKSAYTYTKLTVGYIYDDIFLKHDTTPGNTAPERPARLKEILKKLDEFELLNRMMHVPHLGHSEEQWIEKIHTKEYYDKMARTKNAETPDLYSNNITLDCCLTVVGGVLTLVDEIHAGTISSGVALIRPPGHHARKNEGRGFCHINNVVIAARYLIEKLLVKKVMIIDFDIHHGDGTQSMTYDRKDIFYISVHRYDESKFFPNSKEGSVNNMGTGDALGYNVNIPFNTFGKDKPANYDYLTVWMRIVLPLAYEYQPDFVLVSAGFDAGVNDPLGYYAVVPETFGHLVQMLKPFGKIAVLLEGGYNLETTSLSMAMVVKALLGDPLPMPDLTPLKPQTIETINKVLKLCKTFHPVFQVNKAIADREFTPGEIESYVALE